MTSSRIIPAYNAFLALVQGVVPSMTASLPTRTVMVYDGPQIELPTEQDMILIGVLDPLTSGMITSIDGTSEWVNVGAQTREETFTIHNTYVGWSGDNDFPGLRARMDANLGLIETQLRTIAGIGLNGALIAPQAVNSTGWCGLGMTAMEAVQYPQGCVLHMKFDLACYARI